MWQWKAWQWNADQGGEKKRSIHSRITWTAVTHAMDDDTGVPKVRWNHSKIEDMYLSALNCKRQKVTTHRSGIWMAIRQGGC